jgi:hypothetical protein
MNRRGAVVNRASEASLSIVRTAAIALGDDDAAKCDRHGR